MNKEKDTDVRASMPLEKNITTYIIPKKSSYLKVGGVKN